MNDASNLAALTVRSLPDELCKHDESTALAYGVLLRGVLLATLIGCTNGAALGVGATLDSDRRVGLETDGSVGFGTAHGSHLNPDGYPLDGSLFIVGLAMAVGVTGGGPHVPTTFQLFGEYLQVGSRASPWGYHVKLSIGGMPLDWRGGVGALVVAVTGGPLRTTTQHFHEAGDSFLFSDTGAWSFDLSGRFRLASQERASFAPWQLALSAARHKLGFAAP